MYNFYLIMKLVVLGISASISNYTTEFKMRTFIKYHNRTVKKAIKRYNKNLKKMSTSINSRIIVRDKILNDSRLQKHFSVEIMENLESSIKELDDSIALYHDDFLDYLKVLFDKSKEAIDEYNKIVEKSKRIPYVFYKCTKISMNEIIHDVKYQSRERS